MQPYFLPYIGYFHLLAAVDRFIVYDDVKYTRKGWINRNRILQDGRDRTISLPLKAGADHLLIRERELAADFDRGKLLRRIREAYRHAPNFGQTFPLVEEVVNHDERNLFRFLHHAIVRVCRHLGIATEIVVSSAVDCESGLAGADRVVALCRASAAHTYINAIGGTRLYSREWFAERGITLKFVESLSLEYPQFSAPFVASLSIIDVMMFNTNGATQTAINRGYRLIQPP